MELQKKVFQRLHFRELLRPWRQVESGLGQRLIIIRLIDGKKEQKTQIIAFRLKMYFWGPDMSNNFERFDHCFNENTVTKELIVFNFFYSSENPC